MPAENSRKRWSTLRRTTRRLANAALYSGVRGAATALGGALITLLTWWITHR